MANKRIYQTYEDEVELRQLIYNIIIKRHYIYKFVIAFAMLTAFIFSGYYFVQLHNEDYVSKAKSEYNIDLTVYENKVNVLQTDIENLRNQLNEQELYNHNSLLMKINPYDMYVASLVYYVDSEYQIIPENTYQDIDTSNRIISCYISYLTGGDAYLQLAGPDAEPESTRYIKEIMQVDAEYSTNMIKVVIKGEDAESCRSMIATIKDGMQTTYKKATELIGDHKLLVINENIYPTIDLDLEQQQNTSREYVTSMSAMLQTNSIELKTIEEEGKPQWVYSWQGVTKSIIKKVIIGSIMGFAVAVFLIILKYLLSDKIHGTSELQKRVNLAILGSVPRDSKKTKALDRLAYYIGNIQIKSSNQEKRIKVIAQSILTFIRTKDAEQNQVALVGSVSMEDLAAIADKFNHYMDSAEKCFVPVGNPMLDLSAVLATEGIHFVVLVEKQDISTYSQVYRECERMNNLGKEILGIVLLDVDAS